ncbi:MAG: hypothetical protein V3R99_01160 [Thermoguttaceae bacterium]
MVGHLLRLAAVALLLCSVVACHTNTPLPTEPDGSRELSLPRSDWANEHITSAELRPAIDRSGRYMIRACGPDGQFVYEINLDPSVVPGPQYNILRHAGTIYALAAYYRWQPGEPTREAMLRAADFLKRTSIDAVPEEDDLLAVWSHPEINRGDNPLTAKLGGTGLGLVALTAIERIQPGTTPLDELRRLGRFLVFMQKEDGSFYSKYIPSEGGRSDRWTSLYYPGEAALGLLMLYELDPSPVWFGAAAKCIDYLARLRSGKRDIEADHWALLATAKLLELADRDDMPVDRDAAVRHAADICDSILAGLPRYAPHQAADGCLTRDGRTCPTATRLEGLLAALTFLPESYAPLRARIAQVTGPGIAFLVRAQTVSGEHEGAISRMIPRPTDGYARAADPSETEVRIDYVQHATSAMIQFDHRSAAAATATER